MPWPPLQLSKHAAGYHKAFGELAEREALLACFSCAWQKEVPYHGRLYISSHHICFHASLLLKDIKVVVPVASVSTLKKANTALLVPNALSIRTARGEKFLFVLLRQREATYQVLKSVCKHLQDKSWNSLSNKEVLRKSRTSSQSDLEQSTPEPDSLQDLPDGLIPMPRQAKEEDEEDEEAAALALNSSEWVPLAKPRSLWGGGGGRCSGTTPGLTLALGRADWGWGGALGSPGTDTAPSRQGDPTLRYGPGSRRS
uniref:GRAM domain-containing protein n=1 Tax=Falco tinnunculus TaxID=100819 RepID=A0A8C4XSL7_FALTI